MPGRTPEKIAATEELVGPLSISPDASKVLYHVKQAFKSGDHNTSAIWITSVILSDDSNGAKPITSGLFNDTDAQFHPDGKRIVFLSDRHKVGGPKQLYSVYLNGGEPTPLFGKDNTRGVSMFAISPDGHYIAFTSADEPSGEETMNRTMKNDAFAFGEEMPSDHLRIFSYSSGRVRTLNVSAHRHVYFFTWKADSKELLFATTCRPEPEYREQEVPLQRIAIATGAFEPQTVCTFPQSPVETSPILWLPGGDIIVVYSIDPKRRCDSKGLFLIKNGSLTPLGGLNAHEDVVRVVDLQNSDYFVAEMATGIQTRTDLYKGTEKIRSIANTIDFGSVIRQHAWDVKLPNQGDDSFTVIAALCSFGTMQDPPQVWAGVSQENGVQVSRVTSHYGWLEGAPELQTEEFKWKAADGRELDGVITLPSRDDLGGFGPLPTIMLIHGGPYARHLLDYDFIFTNWRYLLAARGYVVLSPNYRGGVGHGSEFARAASGGAGTVDWSDCESMINEVIKLGIADPNRLGLGGWGYGGFLTAWGISQTKNRFKAAIMGGGVSDWGMLIGESDTPAYWEELVGSTPWTIGQRRDIECSPIRHVSDVETPVLILHGEEDKMFPVSQGKLFFRGLRRQSKFPDRVQLVIYPREGHKFEERKHVEDVWKRVIAHFDEWL